MIYGAPEEIRTPDPQIRSLVLDPHLTDVAPPPNSNLQLIGARGEPPEH
jgi:hypothetical protein